jgi:hypothetical protein
VFWGMGDGTFMQDDEALLSTPSNPRAIAVSDLDDDGMDNVVIIGGGTIVAVYASTGGAFSQIEQFVCPGDDPRGVAIGNLDGDCIDDIVTVTSTSVCAALSNVE